MLQAALEHVGCVKGLSQETYQSVKALSAGGMQWLDKSPWHYWCAHLNPDRPARGQSPQMLAGTLAHCALLEPEAFEERYLVGPDVSKSSAQWRQFIKQNPTLKVIDLQQHMTARHQAQAIKLLPEARRLLSQGQGEISVFWRDKPTSAFCKARPDWVHPVKGEGVILFDLKTTSDASPAGFRKSIRNFRYDRQAAWYSKGYEQATGDKVLAFVFGVIEHDWPYACALYLLDDRTLSKAQADCDRLTQLYAQCLQTDTWPGYPEEVQLLSLDER
jgi:exodeoxyribonuclease VIII